MQSEKILRAETFLARVRNAKTTDHFERIRAAKLVVEVMNSFIALEAQRANHRNHSDPAYLSWDEIAKAMEMSKTAVYHRYGKNRGEG